MRYVLLEGFSRIGKIISHSRILRKIGEAGMGVKCAAQELSLDRRVALKVLPAAVAGDPEHHSRLEAPCR